MFKTALASIALAGLLTVGGVGATVLAEESTPPIDPEQPPISISFNKEEKAAELAQQQADMEAMAAAIAEKRAAFAAARANMDARLAASDKSTEQLAALRERFSAQFEEVAAERGTEITANQAERKANMANRADPGVERGNIQTTSTL